MIYQETQEHKGLNPDTSTQDFVSLIRLHLSDHMSLVPIGIWADFFFPNSVAMLFKWLYSHFAISDFVGLGNLAGSPLGGSSPNPQLSFLSIVAQPW